MPKSAIALALACLVAVRGSVEPGILRAVSDGVHSTVFPAVRRMARLRAAMAFFFRRTLGFS